MTDIDIENLRITPGTLEAERVKTLEAENELLRDRLLEVQSELDQTRKRVKWFKKMVARLCKDDLDRRAAIYGKSNRPID